MDGLATIRSRNVQTELCHEFDELQNVHSSVWQLTMTSITAFGFWIDFLCWTFSACVTFSFIVLYDSKAILKLVFIFDVNIVVFRHV